SAPPRLTLLPIQLLDEPDHETLRRLYGGRDVPPLHVPFLHLIADAAYLQAVDAVAQAGQRNRRTFHVFGNGPDSLHKLLATHPGSAAGGDRDEAAPGKRCSMESGQPQ